MKKRRTQGPSRTVKGTFADYTLLGESQLSNRTHYAQDLAQARIEMEQRRDAAFRGMLYILSCCFL